MVCTVGDIISLMEEIAPESWAEEWDNVSLLVGNPRKQVKGLMVVLDISPQVVEEATEKKVDMIISHHPLYLNPLNRITNDDLGNNLIISLIKADISVYCAHTNLDMAYGGVDDTLAGILGLKNVKPLFPQNKDAQLGPGFGRIGTLPIPKGLIEYIKDLGQILNTPLMEYIGEVDTMGEKLIKTVALCSGSGADFMDQALIMKSDLFITGEIKYHDALRALWTGIDVLKVGHFYSEIPIVKELINRLQTRTDSLQYKVEVLESEMQRSPYSRIF